MNKKFILIARGGIGDAIVCTPAIRALKEKYPKCTIIVYCPKRSHADVFVHNPYIDSVRVLNVYRMLRYPFHLFAYIFNRKLVKYIPLSFQHVMLYPYIFTKNVKEIIAEIFDLTIQSNNVEIYLTEKEERIARQRLLKFGMVVVLHVHSRSAMNHLWKVENWVQLVKSLPEYTFIQVGHKDEPHIAGAVDLRGKTSLREAFALVKYSKSFVGVDSNFSHVTNAFNIPGVVLFGDSSPIHWGHDNNINLFKALVCSPCYYFLRYCKCPYDHECMNQITVEEVRAALIAQVSKNVYMTCA